MLKNIKGRKIVLKKIKNIPVHAINKKINKIRR